jgi:hypothetical protein
MCFLFVKDGVFKRRVGDVSADNFAPFLWAFIDTDGSPSGVPETLGGHDTNLYIIFITYPKRQGWKTLTKCTSCVEIIMNTWSLEEIRQA